MTMLAVCFLGIVRLGAKPAGRLID